MEQQPTTPGARSHASRTFSFRSDKSGGSRPKEDLTESPKEKQRRDSIWKNTSKANPNAAITEAQPGGVFALPSTLPLTTSTLSSFTLPPAQHGFCSCCASRQQ
jgi:hypothetical protein